VSIHQRGIEKKLPEENGETVEWAAVRKNERAGKEEEE